MMAADALKRLRPFQSVGLVARWWEGGRLSSHGWIREIAIFWWERRQRRAPFPPCLVLSNKRYYVNKNQFVCSILSVIGKYLISTFILWLSLFQYLLSIQNLWCESWNRFNIQNYLSLRSQMRCAVWCAVWFVVSQHQAMSKHKRE